MLPRILVKILENDELKFEKKYPLNLKDFNKFKTVFWYLSVGPKLSRNRN